MFAAGPDNHSLITHNTDVPFPMVVMWDDDTRLEIEHEITFCVPQQQIYQFSTEGPKVELGTSSRLTSLNRGGK